MRRSKLDSNQLHKPVLASQILEAMQGFFTKDQEFQGVDGTFGRGGHTSILLESFSNLRVIALDQDLEAIEYGKQYCSTAVEEGNLSLHHVNFSDQAQLSKILPEQLDFVFLDIGVSSPQLDDPERGFSFYHQGPLDMRMDQSQSLTAAEVLNTFSKEELRTLFEEFGEVRAPEKLLEKILNHRLENPFVNTRDFAGLIERVCGWRKKGRHPATQYFQALRIFVNNELGALEKALEFYVDRLRADGLFLIITFHSLEDRMVKYFFKNSTLGKPVNKKVIKPTRDEQKSNPRSRSAKLRIFKKGEFK